MNHQPNRLQPQAIQKKSNNTRFLAGRLNEDAAPGDRVSGEALRNKVRQKEHDRNFYGHNDQINTPQPEDDQPARRCGRTKPMKAAAKNYMQDGRTFSGISSRPMIP